MTLQEIEEKINSLREKIFPLHEEMSRLINKKQEVASREFIAANNIKMSDIELPDGDDRPYFFNLSEFANFLKKQPSVRRFSLWNGTLCFTSDILSGRFNFDGPGRIKDVPK